MIGATPLFFLPRGLGTERPQNTKPEAELGVWRQTPCLLPAIFCLFVINPALPHLQTHLLPLRKLEPPAVAPALHMQIKPGWRKDVQHRCVSRQFCNSTLAHQEDSHD